ncbi:D-Ala-D-Ala carboxypeptidase family metallohydrolase [Novosphingobium resinovorum]|uniref:D-Ala-D-Ala carboxypeptidase family metallohydrolase n=1 Tax=Novosphingobium resinovorum TaxID=158500 RepID=UPI002ECFF222|nr:D-Ala-D-Ala carboxypeptidase family metallohydrolase [Novosphingobium resinovorum]
MNYDAQSLAAVIEQRRDIMLTPHFRLSELLRTHHGADNWPAHPDEILALRYLCEWVLERVRAQFGRPVRIIAGFRSPAVNALAGGATGSQHLKGEAAEFAVPGVSNAEVARWIRDNLVFDQLVLEYPAAGDTASGRVSCSIVRQGNRRAVMTSRRSAKTGRVTYTGGLDA